MFLISTGRLFHSFGAADWKARSPGVGRHRALADTNRVAFLGLRLYLDWGATAIRSTPKAICKGIASLQVVQIRPRKGVHTTSESAACSFSGQIWTYFGPILGQIPFISLQCRGSKPSNFAIFLVFLSIKAC